MKVLRKFDSFELNEGNGAAKGLYNVSNEDNEVSLWFDTETKDVIMAMSDKDFADECLALIAYSRLIS